MDKNDLKELSFLEISLMEIEENKTLILMCEDGDKASRLFEILQRNRYNVKAMLTKRLTHKIAVEFIDENLFIGLDTNMSSNSYAKASWLTYGLVTRLTVGYREDKDNIRWISQLLPLRSANLN